MGTLNSKHIEGLTSNVVDRMNQRNLADLLAFLLTKENLALQVRTIAAGGRTQLDNRDCVVLYDGSGGGFSATLPAANTWKGRSPIIILKRIDAAIGTYRILPSGSETIDGAAGVVIAANASLILITNGIDKWYSV